MRVLELQLTRRGPFVRVPQVTGGERRVLRELVVLECGGRVQGSGFEQARSGFTGILRRLIGKGLVDVVGVNPGRYRVTRLGRHVVRLR